MLSDQDDISALEQICTPSPNAIARKNEDPFKTQFEKLPKLSYEKVKTVVDMIFHLSNYIVEEAIEKNQVIDRYEKLYPINNDFDNKFQMKPKLAKSTIQASSIEGEFAYTSNNPILKPAFDCIHDSSTRDLSLTTLANLCHVSPSYLSRLFTKETGENLSSYISRVKIERSKQLLETTEMTISQISSELGFSDDGYFIKIFKKQAGQTPLQYRKYTRG